MLPNPETVFVAWLKSHGIANVATTLPEPSTWATQGFVTVTAVGGAQDPFTFMQAPRIQVDCWGHNTNSQKLPWNKTAGLAMKVKSAAQASPREVVTPFDYEDALVHSVLIESDMRKVSDDVYARYSMDLRAYWTPIPIQENQP